ncbi:MAG: hypothetical protein E7774_08005 [Bradyrhizobium sp.]|nr:MAG: hypothetical protein E7774_08005 [Bradyrhizobium sp.]
MTRHFRWVLAAAIFATMSSSALASGWNGTWSGEWGGNAQQATSVTVAGNRVVSYSYQGVSHPVAASVVTATKITYEDEGNNVTLTRTGEKTAHATLHSGNNDATAELTLQ